MHVDVRYPSRLSWIKNHFERSALSKPFRIPLSRIGIRIGIYAHARQKSRDRSLVPTDNTITTHLSTFFLAVPSNYTAIIGSPPT